MQGLVQILFNGVAYGMLLFLMSVGLSITLGMMNFANLAHGAFAMLGGYVTATLMIKAGWPFFATLPAAFVVVALGSVVIERLLFRRMYTAKPLDQVLLTIGVIYMAIAGGDYIWGPEQMPISLPSALTKFHDLGWFQFSIYGLVLVLAGGAITLAVFLGIERTRFGAMIRASVDNRVVAQGVGVDVNKVFSITFAIGSGLAGLGGALGINQLGLDPSFPLKYLVYFLIVVNIGGAGSVKGSLVAALVLGVLDEAGKYYVPQIDAFVIYAVMLAMMLWRPNGLFGRP
jgi:branched-chain amino acid transport system permease protein